MVVSGHAYATAIGNNILKQGGNAIDAAVAIGYALAVVHPCCGNIGGGGFMTIRFANGKTTFINFRERAPALAKPEHFLDSQGRVLSENLSVGHISGSLAKPYLAVGVPGTVMGLNTALARYGSLPLSKVIAPAIQLAQEGFILLPSDEDLFKTSEISFREQPNVAQIFLKNNRTYRAGERLIQKNLADTLKAISKGGTEAFYQGEIAAKIAQAAQENGGLITKEDLRHYYVDEVAPLECDYKNYHIITAPPPGSGVTICQALKIVEAYPLRDLGFHSAMGSHYILEALRFSYADRNQFLGDPRFVHNPVDKMLSPQYIQQIRARIKPNKTTPSSFVHFNLEGGNTTAYVVVDKKGNAVSVTYTLNDYFGAKVIAKDTGFFLNNEMADFTIKPDIANNYGLYQGKPNLIAPHKQPLSSMAPTIITKNNQLFMIIGTPGGSTIASQLIGVILNVIEYNMNIQEAEDMPRFHMQWLPDVVFMERFTFSADTLRILANMGYRFQLGSPYGTLFWGAVAGIVADQSAHLYYGAMDSRRSNGSANGQ
jgi:gamma-glutamyltranspeptidase/glutathione hydrolase